MLYSVQQRRMLLVLNMLYVPDPQRYRCLPTHYRFTRVITEFRRAHYEVGGHLVNLVSRNKIMKTMGNTFEIKTYPQ
jgi:hypothetical protein